MPARLGLPSGVRAGTDDLVWASAECDATLTTDSSAKPLTSTPVRIMRPPLALSKSRPDRFHVVRETQSVHAVEGRELARRHELILVEAGDDGAVDRTLGASAL